MRALVRLVCCAVLLWQAIAAAKDRVPSFWRAGAAGLRESLTADTEARLRRALGADAALCGELRALVPPGQLLLNRQVQGSLEELRASTGSEQEFLAAFQRLAARNGLFVQLTGLLFPDPFLFSVPDPIALVEAKVADGEDPWLFVFDGDPVPAERAGWRCTHRGSRFQLWRFQQG